MSRIIFIVLALALLLAMETLPSPADAASEEAVAAETAERGFFGRWWDRGRGQGRGLLDAEEQRDADVERARERYERALEKADAKRDQARKRGEQKAKRKAAKTPKTKTSKAGKSKKVHKSKKPGESKKGKPKKRK